MNRDLVERIARAVLYEGYILYPYRPSVKNRQRWTFGGLYPESSPQTCDSSERSANQTECLVEGNADTTVEVAVRFLHLTQRQVMEFDSPLPGWPPEGEPPSRRVEVLHVGNRQYHTWQEAEERTVTLADLRLGDLIDDPTCRNFGFPGRRWLEPVHEQGGAVRGMLVREQQAVAGRVEVSAAAAAGGLYRLTVRVRNVTPLAAACPGRDEALLHSLISTHEIFGVENGEFVSLLDPPGAWREQATACKNAGTWPVLVGEAGERDTLLSSPIILYDYPEVAPESPGDLFDATEIDEILYLRILTLTPEEKEQMAGVDERACALLERTEALPAEQWLGLHGTLRIPRPSEEVGHV